MFPLAALTLKGYFSASPLNADPLHMEYKEAEEAVIHSLKILSADRVDSRQRSLAFENYQSAVMKLLPILKDRADSGAKDPTKFFDTRDLVELTPIERSRIRVSGLHRDGLGLSLI